MTLGAGGAAVPEVGAGGGVVEVGPVPSNDPGVAVDVGDGWGAGGMGAGVGVGDGWAAGGMGVGVGWAVGSGVGTGHGAFWWPHL